MSKELSEELYQVVQNEEVNSKLIQCHTPEECYKVISEYVHGMTMQDFIEHMQLIYESCQENSEGLLDDDELDNVAGGMSKQEIAAIVTSGSTVAAASLAAT